MQPSQFTPLSFRCFERYFLQRNVRQKKVELFESSEDFAVLNTNLEGYASLWEIALEAENEEVATHAAKFLILLQMNYAQNFLNAAKLINLREKFISDCLRHYMARAVALFPRVFFRQQRFN